MFNIGKMIDNYVIITCNIDMFINIMLIRSLLNVISLYNYYDNVLVMQNLMF